MKFIYSKALEKQLFNVDYKVARNLYRQSMPDIYGYGSTFYEVIVQKQFSNPKAASKAMNKQHKAYIDFMWYIKETEDKYSFYWCNHNGSKYYTRYYMLSIDEATLLNVYRDKILLLV